MEDLSLLFRFSVALTVNSEYTVIEVDMDVILLQAGQFSPYAIGVFGLNDICQRNQQVETDFSSRGIGRRNL